MDVRDIELAFIRTYHELFDKHGAWIGLGYLRFCNKCGWVQIKEKIEVEGKTTTQYVDFTFDDYDDSWMTPQIMLQVSKELDKYIMVGRNKRW